MNKAPRFVAEWIGNVHALQMLRRLILPMMLLMLSASPARALCSGETMQREFQEADIVVRARLVSELNAWDDEPSAVSRDRWGNGAPVVLYGLRVLDTFKGAPSPRLSIFQERNSAAFYLDADKDYLLFLHYIPIRTDQPTAARGALYVRHACGQSKPWAEVQPADLATLQRLSHQR